jgi:sigma-B regulation protein RsbU (phosphoserine phosphatase)
VTLFYGILDPHRHSLCFTNAGHENPFLLSGGKELRRLSDGGLVLSIVEDFPYQEATVELASGDVMVVYSDGISEAINPNQEQFGEARLYAVVEEHRHESANDIIEQIVRAVRQYASGAAQMDDMTLVVLKRFPA